MHVLAYFSARVAPRRESAPPGQQALVRCTPPGG